MVNQSKTLLGLLAITVSVDAYWRMSCGLIQTGRVDPIISPGGVAGHVHKVSGASNFGMSSSFKDLQSSRCTSCEVQDDKSAYWTPQLFYLHANGSFEMVPNGGTVVYYLGRGENRTNIEPFPPGFKMLSGDSGARSNDATTMTYNSGKVSGRPVSDRVSFACLDSSGGMPEQNHMFRTDCDNGMRAQVHFQSCWNGAEYASDQSHVAYMSKIDNGVCPPTHPRQLPHLFLEVIYGVNDIDKSKGGQFVFANGDTTGYGFHGDFLNGWNTDILKNAIKQCINNDATNGGVSACPPLAVSQTPYFSTNCPERPSIVNELVRGMLDKLPGCNPVTSGPGRAAQQVCPVQPSTNDLSDPGLYAMFPSAVGTKMSTWAYAGCAAEGSTRTLSKYATSSNAMTIDSCVAACKAQGYPLAGLENSRECYCANELTTGASYMKPAACAAAPKMVCGGNQTQWCGAPSLLDVWNDTSYTPPAPLLVNSTKIANGIATYFGCWSEGSSGRALPSDRTANATGMTNEMCVAYCKTEGYAYAGTEYAQECYCGDKIGGTNITDITQCSMKCKGDMFSYCGAGSKLSIWQIAQPPKSNDPVTALDGTAAYLGCFTDGGAGGRTLPSASFAGSSVSLDTCAAFCRKGNYPVFGMEYGSECYCGFATKTQATLASDSDCNMKCAGNSSQKCGAGNRLSVWNNTLLYKPSSSSSSAKSTSTSTTKSTSLSTSTTTTSSSKTPSTPSSSTSTLPPAANNRLVVPAAKGAAEPSLTTTTSKTSSIKTTSTPFTTAKKTTTSSTSKKTSTTSTSKKISTTSTSKKASASVKLQDVKVPSTILHTTTRKPSTSSTSKLFSTSHTTSKTSSTSSTTKKLTTSKPSTTSHSTIKKSSTTSTSKKTSTAKKSSTTSTSSTSKAKATKAEKH